MWAREDGEKVALALFPSECFTRSPESSTRRSTIFSESSVKSTDLGVDIVVIGLGLAKGDRTSER